LPGLALTTATADVARRAATKNATNSFFTPYHLLPLFIFDYIIT